MAVFAQVSLTKTPAGIEASASSSSGSSHQQPLLLERARREAWSPGQYLSSDQPCHWARRWRGGMSHKKWKKSDTILLPRHHSLAPVGLNSCAALGWAQARKGKTKREAYPDSNQFNAQKVLELHSIRPGRNLKKAFAQDCFILFCFECK